MNWIDTVFPRSIERMKVLHCEIVFQDLEKVLNLAIMYIKYWKSMEIQNLTICLFRFVTAQQPQLPYWYNLFKKGLIIHLQMNLLNLVL